MIERRLTYSTLQRDVTKQLYRHFLFHGLGGPLVFLWSVGTGLFLFLLNLPEYALVWTGAVSVLTLGMVIFHLGDQKVRALALQSVVAKWFLTHAIPDLSLGREVQTGIETFTQIALQIAEMEKRHGRDHYLRRVLTQSFGLLALQHQQAGKVAALEAGENPELHQEEADQAYSLAHETLAQLETVDTVLQALQHTRPPHEVAAGITELAREAEETLRRMQARAANPSHREAPPSPSTAGIPPGPGTPPLSPPRPPVRPISDLVAQHRADRYSPPELKGLREALQLRLARLNSADGLKALLGLVREYGQLMAMLAHHPDASSLTVAQTTALAEEAYRRALNVLGTALDLIPATDEPQQERLERDIAELEAKIATAHGDNQQAERLPQLQDRLASNQKQLETDRRQRLRLEQLLNQCHHIEVSLDQTRNELALLKADSAESRVSGVTQPLSRVIDQAKEVQEELKQSGW